MDYHKFLQATSRLQQAAAAKRHSFVTTTKRDVASALERDDYPRAAAAIGALLARQPGAMRWWHELASVRQKQGNFAAAEEAWQQALQCDIEKLPLLHRIGKGLRAAGHDPAGFAEHAWASKPEMADSPATGFESSRPPEFRQACLAVLRNDWAKALPVFKLIQQASPADRQSALNLAFLLSRLDRKGQSQCVLAVNLLAQDQALEAVEAFEAVPEADARAPEYLGHFLHALRLVGKEQRAIQIAETVTLASCSAVACDQWAQALLDTNRLEEAVEILRQGATVHHDQSLRLKADLVLPPVPASQQTMEQAHQRVCRAIHALSASPLPEDPKTLASLEQALQPNFFLAYLGKPYVHEARAYGRFVERVMQARFPQYAEQRPQRQRAPGDRIRIGCATSYMNHHVVMKCFAGWLEHADRNAFETHLFPLATEMSAVTGYLATLADICHPPATTTEVAARQIYESELDFLVYPEIGMDALTFRLAAMRLAPVQCVAGGHPTTTGLATLDYFLSVAGAEPTNATGHYTERLVSLPEMGLCMPLPVLPVERKSRADFGLTADQVVYLSSQELFKHLPINDELFARIAESVDNAVFVIVEGHFPAWTRTFSERLRRTFESRGLSPERHLRFVPRQDYDDYLCLNAISDVFLDPPGGFSGGMTSRDALAFGLPVVTLPGTMMRTRQSCGLLTQLCIKDTIATDLDDYVGLSIRLGKDADWRAELSQRIQDQCHLIFDDTRGMVALAAFFRWATGSSIPGEEMLFKLECTPV